MYSFTPHKISLLLFSFLTCSTDYVPGHYLCASKASLRAVCDGNTASLTLASLDDPHLTIERLEPQHVFAQSQHQNYEDHPQFNDRAPSVPLCDETYRRVSFTLTDVTDGGGGGGGGGATDLTLAAELDDIAAYCAYKFKLTSMSKSQKPTVTVKDTRDQLLQQHPGCAERLAASGKKCIL